METLQARREWQEIFQVMRTKGLQPRLLYPARLSIKIEGQIKSFQDKRSLKEYASTKPALQEILKGLL
jgi:Holliday junction resolvase RusA-like endonuclease